MICKLNSRDILHYNYYVLQDNPLPLPSSRLEREGRDYTGHIGGGRNRFYRPEFSGRKEHSRQDRFCIGHPPGSQIVSLDFPTRYLLTTNYLLISI